MSIIFKPGSIFDAPEVGLVNPVNCLGVSGAGLALEFARRYPENAAEYRSMCRAGSLRPGDVFAFMVTRERWILNAATKDDWREFSRREWIENILTVLNSWLAPIRNTSSLSRATLAIPPIGCGLGGLDKEWLAARLVEQYGADDRVEVGAYGFRKSPQQART